MTTQTEKQLEDQLIAQLTKMGYTYIDIPDEAAMLANFKKQLEIHNEIGELSEQEWKQIITQVSKGNIFEKAKRLRERLCYKKDDHTDGYLTLLDLKSWCQNEYQVTRQISMEGKYANRYDVTILINGLPLVQIELKKRGLELKEAFEQTNRYERHSYTSGASLFQYIQLFVISNGVNTKYYANNPIKARSFKQTFYWSDEKNRLITQLSDFTVAFFDTCHLSRMITQYIVLNQSNEILMVLRPYQFYAVEAIINQVVNTTRNGYIWHTTGSGKTLTSFKASQILTTMSEVDKVLFVVDRKDLDFQTIKEFNSFKKDSVDGTDKTKNLVDQLANPNIKLIVTTLQKLDVAIKKKRYQKVMEPLKDKKVVFIFDECHRSQFGKTHKRINEHFTNSQMFGFTGTPIFAENAHKNDTGKHTTKELFHEELHQYVITDAIRDENVLKFSVEYISTFKRKDQIVDIEVEAIDTKEVMDDSRRLENITDYIIANHNRKTKAKEFTAIFCVSGIPVLVQYYEMLRRKKLNGEHNLKVATIFSYQANEKDTEAKGITWDDEFEDEKETQYAHSREKLDEYIADYNEMFGTKYSTKSGELFYDYYKDISKRVKNRHIDILLVVDMFLTGFDSPMLNTIYIDKNLKYHGLIQAYSRTNRILNEIKSQGNIVCFRNLKKRTDDALALFSDTNASSEIFMPPYEEVVNEFNTIYIELLKIAPTVDSVNHLISEDDQLEFVKIFRSLMRLMNKLSFFSDFEFSHLSITEQSFNDYKSKYLDLYERVRTDRSTEKVSILEDIDFEIELIHRDEINVAYILRLLIRYKGETEEERVKIRKEIDKWLSTEVRLRSKRELIDRFIEENLPDIEDESNVENEFYEFVDKERLQALIKLSEEENLTPEKLQILLSGYLFDKKAPLTDDIVGIMNQKPGLKERRTTAARVWEKIQEYLNIYVEDL